MNMTLHHHLDTLWLELHRISASTNHLLDHVYAARRLIREAKPALSAEPLWPVLVTLITELEEMSCKAHRISAVVASSRCTFDDVKTQIRRDEKNDSL